MREDRLAMTWPPQAGLGAGGSAREVTVLEARNLPPPAPLAQLLRAALDAPIEAAPLSSYRARRVTVIVSDATRREPRAAFLDALRDHLGGAHWTIAVATGTHGPSAIEPLDIPKDLLRDATLVNHDGARADGWIELGTTERGTPVRVHRCVVDTDLIVATGCIRPHYFAGFGAGVKAIFPGLGETRAIRANHRLKTELGARAGIVDGNPCRDDLEQAVAMIPTPMFLVNGVCAPAREPARPVAARDDRARVGGGRRTDVADGVDEVDANRGADVVQAVVAGDVRAAFRRGAELATPWFTVRGPRAQLVIATDLPPVTSSLYQAAKMAAAVAPMVLSGGTLAIVAPCEGGTGPIEVVNEAIFRIGVLPRLAPGVRLALVSSLERAVVEQTLLEYAASVDELLESHPGPVASAVRASQLICEPDS